jgi:putative transposase
MIGSYRWFYNQGVSYLCSLDRGFFIPKGNSKKGAEYILYEGDYFKVETGGEYAYGIIPKYDSKEKQVCQTGFQAIRNYLKTKIPEWYTQLPIHLIDQASRECASNFKSIIEKRKHDKKKFSMKYKSKNKSVSETINMEKSSLNNKGKIYSSVFKGIDTGVYTREPIDFKNNNNEYKIIYDRNTYEYHIALLIKHKKNKNPIDNDKWCSIDPGEKIFATVYNAYDREVLFLGHDERNSFNDSTISKLQRSMSRKTNTNKRIALQRARNRDKNRRQEMHHKIANYLCSNFKHIIVPNYGIKSMKLQSGINRSMRNLGFYQFLTFLKHKCVETNVKIYIVNESYTSQACCNCGCLNKPDDRDYTCKNEHCKMEIHRDANGAVNIALKHLKSR